MESDKPDNVEDRSRASSHPSRQGLRGDIPGPELAWIRGFPSLTRCAEMRRGQHQSRCGRSNACWRCRISSAVHERHRRLRSADSSYFLASSLQLKSRGTGIPRGNDEELGTKSRTEDWGTMPCFVAHSPYGESRYRIL
eukprot:jgi/Botrbrau1/8115/Bobra.0308s0010.1